MELKSYQQEVINDLTDFLDYLQKTEHLGEAFSQFWGDKGVSLQSFEDDYLKPYDNSIKGVPRVTVKVPTAGGKTFIACNALRPIFDTYPVGKPQVVVWFVPSDTILKQTYKNLNNPSHPYRQKIDSHFGSAVTVYEKEGLLFGQGFSPTDVKEQLSILVLSVQSFASNNKDGRRVYRENENLAEFPKTYQHKSKLLPDVDDTSLIQVLSQLNPVVIIDESHNFEADLRIDMLNNLNPSFVLDLTATPRKKSNIISFVDAYKLKINHMVKLPVIVYNHYDSNNVIGNAIQMRNLLEDKAKKEEENGGKYIRPIVLFQAQPKKGSENITFDKIKAQLIELGIPEDQVKIKTAQKDEIKNIDLMSRDCSIRYIITVNALKEGWDCPFAYILASLANRSSTIDVEQILGRVLRLPNVRENKDPYLNSSYVFTSSADFLATVDKIIIGLNKAGFSAKDYRIEDGQKEPTVPPKEIVERSIFEEPTENYAVSGNEEDFEINTDTIKELTHSEEGGKQLQEIMQLTQEVSSEYDKAIEQAAQEDNNTVPIEIADKMKTFPIKEVFVKEAKGVQLPTFFKKVAQKSLFEEEGGLIPLTKKMLLTSFDLKSQNKEIDLIRTKPNMMRVDLIKRGEEEYTPEYRELSDVAREAFLEHLSTLPPEGQVNQLAYQLASHISRFDEIAQPVIKEYIKEVIINLGSDKISEIAGDEYFYANQIKKKINQLTNEYAEKKFVNLLDKGDIICQDSFTFDKRIAPKNTTHGITKHLYTEEGEMNSFERTVINAIANVDKVVFWHRNLERGKGFCINGFINHYPDFIIKMKSGKIVVIETKGDDRDNSDSLKKIKLGEKWASKAGENYRYFMVFENAKLEGAKSVLNILDILNGLG